MSTSPSTQGEYAVLAIALKPARGAPMQEVSAAEALEGAGLTGGARPSAARGLTFLSAGQWREAQAELKGDKPWHTRRANVLLDADGLAHLVGCRVQVGQAVVDVTGETMPCEQMDALQPGLQETLRPQMRGGVFGRVITSGALAVGDRLRIIGPIPADSPAQRRRFRETQP